jgi:transcriptional regulator with XRE-family HTH domain
MAAARKTPSQIRLGKAVKHVRTQVGMTQEQVANKVDMHATYISDIERGARNPSWEAIARLARGMGVGVAEIAADYDRRSK